MSAKAFVKHAILAALRASSITGSPALIDLYLRSKLRWNAGFDIEAARKLAKRSKAAAHQITAGKTLLYGSESRASRIKEAEACFQTAVDAQNNNAGAIALLGVAVDSQGKKTEARGYYEQALALDANNEIARQYLARLPTPSRGTSRYNRFPEAIDELRDLPALIAQEFLPRLPTLDKDIRRVSFVTVGSCFAANLSNALVAEGLKSTTLTIGEEVNSTFANRGVFEWALGDHEAAKDKYPFVASEYDRHKLRAEIEKTDVLVLTLGVAPGFFKTADGSFSKETAVTAVRGLRDGSLIYRQTTSDENFDNVARIVELIRAANPMCTVFITVSPVPLNTTFDGLSAFEADCISKSTLRLTAARCVKELPNCHYWPSFEIVRWIGAYVPNMYGEDDGSTFHVSERVVATIVKAFLSKIAGAKLNVA